MREIMLGGFWEIGREQRNMIERDESFLVRVTLEDGTVEEFPSVSGPYAETAMRTALMLFGSELKRRGIEENTVVSVSVTACIAAGLLP
jgi:hypothetical protein